jgi:SAM-dependent methyltransferase
MKIRQLSTAPWLSQAMYAAAKLGIADLLVDGSRPVEELAQASGAHPDTLYRLLRALASVEIFAEPRPRAFALNPAAAQLRSDRPDSVRHVVIMHGEETFRAWAEILHTVQTGEPAFDKVYGVPFYQYLAKHPAAEEVFNAAMGVSGQPPMVIDGLDLSRAGTVVDVGGGSGALLARVLQQHPDARGAVLDLPDAIADAQRRFAEAGLAQRAEGVVGSFFDGVPAGDAYLLCRVLHNWDDEDVRVILRNIRAAAPVGARLYVLDRIVPDVPGPHPGKVADLVMLVVLGGRDRTRPEYEALLQSADFDVEAVIDPPPGADPRAESAIVAVVQG